MAKLIGSAVKHKKRAPMQTLDAAFISFDKGVESVKNAILGFNDRLKDGLPEEEILNTIMVTVIKAVTKRDAEE